MRKYFATLAVLLTVVALMNIPAFAQTVDSTIVGTVTDATGAGVPNANVEAANVATGVKSTTKANANGEYRFNNIPVGRYNITGSAPGFTSAAVNGLTTQLNQTSTVNLSMQVGSVSTTVDVQEANTVIDTTTAQVQNTFEVKQAMDLPTASVGSGVLNLALLSAGVASSGGVGSGSGPSVGGQRPRNNNFMVEGVDNNSKSVTGPLIFIPNDAVQNFTLLQNQFSPEFGHSSGGQFNTIVRSGTNEYHGVVYDYLQNRNLNAVNQALANQGIFSNPRYDQNRLGGQIGGPIKRNKLFFFANFEYNPIGQASTPAAATLTPTAAGYVALGSLPGVSATNLGILKQYATPAPTSNGSPITVGGRSVDVGILPIAAPNFSNSYYGVGSMDYNISDRDQLRGRFVYNKNSAIDTAPNLPAFYLSNPTTYYLATLTEYHTFTPNLTNELRIGYNRYNNTTAAGNFAFPGLDQFPNLTIDELNLQLGPDPNAPQFTIQNLYQGTDNMTFIRGSHTFKVGYEFRKYISPQFFTQRARGDYEYDGLNRFLLDQTPDQLAERSLGSPIYYGDQIANYAYLNDTWRLRPNFTVNLGLRYEYTTVPQGQRLQALNAIASVPGLLEFKEPKAQTTGFAPRIGIAYSPGSSGTTSIRAGFGMAYDVIYDNIGILSLPPQFSTTVDVEPSPTNPTAPGFLKGGGITPNASGGGPLSAADARAGTASYIPDQKLPYSIQWNIGIQHVFAKDYTFEARYLGTRGVHLNVQRRINRIALATADKNLPTYLAPPATSTLTSLPYTLGTLRPSATSSFDPRFLAAGFTSNIVEFDPIGNSSYHGLALQLNRRFSNNLQFIGAYTWSHTIDDSTADFFSTLLTPRRPQDFLNYRNERATSALDRRHRVTFTAIYDFQPFKGSSNWMMKNLVGNWEIAPIYTYESPELATVQSAVDSNLNGDAFGDRAILNPAGTPGTGSGVYAIDRTGARVTTGSNSTVAYVALNPNAQYIVAQAGAFPNVSRNTLPTRPINNWDVTLLKRFSRGERYKLEFQGQFLNALNHAQFTPGVLNDIRSIGQTATGVRNYLTPNNPAFNNPEVTFGSNPRSIQLVMKVIF